MSRGQSHIHHNGRPMTSSGRPLTSANTTRIPAAASAKVQRRPAPLRRSQTTRVGGSWTGSVGGTPSILTSMETSPDGPVMTTTAV
jgi:hypothetical protein